MITIEHDPHIPSHCVEPVVLPNRAFGHPLTTATAATTKTTAQRT